jgi:hypothetical protein
MFCNIYSFIIDQLSSESQWRSHSASVSNVRGSGFELVRDKKFQVHMRRPNYLGLVTLTSFRWDNKPRSSVCTHSEHQARTIKILQSMCISHKIVETYRNQHAQRSQKGKWNDDHDAPMAGWWGHSHLRMWHLLRTDQYIGQAPWAFDRMDMCATKVFNQSINQCSSLIRYKTVKLHTSHSQ